MGQIVYHCQEISVSTEELIEMAIRDFDEELEKDKLND